MIISIISGLISGSIVAITLPVIDNHFKLQNISATLSIQNESVSEGSSHHRELVTFYIKNLNNERLNNVKFSVGFPRNITEIVHDYSSGIYGSPDPEIEIDGNHVNIMIDFIDCYEFGSIGFIVVWQKDVLGFPVIPEDGPWLSTDNFGIIDVEIII